MEIKFIELKANTVARMDFNDWFILQTLISNHAGIPRCFVAMIRGQSKELMEFIKSYKMAKVEELMARVEGALSTPKKK